MSPPWTTGTASEPRVALVHDWLTGLRGGEKVLEELVAVFPTAEVFTLVRVPGSAGPRVEGRPIHTSWIDRIPGARRRYRQLLPLLPAAIEDFDLTAFDLVVSSSHCVAKGAIPAPGARHVCYCHSPMRYAWDQEHEYFPQRRGVIARIRGLLLSRLRLWDIAASSRVDTFVANSHFVAERIRRYYRRDAQVVHPPVEVDFFTPTPQRPRQDFVLSVQALVPYKRIDLAIEAMALAGRELVVVGDGPERRRLERLAAGRAKFLGSVDRERLRELYRDAACVIQPGVEDFGIAAVEALACGTPVVAVGRGGVLDIVEDGRHGVLVDPRLATPAALAAAVDKCLAFRFDCENLQRQAERFSAAHFRAGLEAVLAADSDSSVALPE